MSGAVALRPGYAPGPPAGRSLRFGARDRARSWAALTVVGLLALLVLLLVPAGGVGRPTARVAGGTRTTDQSHDGPARAELGVRPPRLLSAGGVDRRHSSVARGLLAVLFVAIGAITAGSTPVGRTHAVAPVRPRVGRPSSRGPPVT